MLNFENFCIQFTECMNEMASELGYKWEQYGYSYSPFLPNLPIDSEPIDQNSANEIAVIIHDENRIMSMFDDIVYAAPFLSDDINSARTNFVSRNFRSALRDVFAFFDGFVFHKSLQRPTEKNIPELIKSGQYTFKNIEIYSAWRIMSKSYEHVKFGDEDDANRLIPSRHFLVHGLSVRQYMDYDFVRIFVALYVIVLNYKNMPLPTYIRVVRKAGD